MRQLIADKSVSRLKKTSMLEQLKRAACVNGGGESLEAITLRDFLLHSCAFVWKVCIDITSISIYLVTSFRPNKYQMLFRCYSPPYRHQVCSTAGCA